MNKEDKMDTLLSIIVPVYNIKEYLPRCVASICAQTYRNLEILLVDDGSTDGTEVLCDELATKDERIRVFHKENGGSSTARNLGIAKAQGEFLGFVDSDDYIEPDMYEKLFRVLKENNGVMAQIGRDERNEAGERLPDICIPPDELVCYEMEDFLKELLLHKGDCSFCTKLVAKKLFAENKFPEGVLNEDFRLLIEMFQHIDCIYSLPGYGYHVFYRIGSNTRKKDKNEFSRVYADNIDNANLAEILVDMHYPALREIGFRFGCYQRLDYLLHIPIGQMTEKNDRYKRVVRYIREDYWKILKNHYLTVKNKIYLTLFAIAPQKVREVHASLKGL